MRLYRLIGLEIEALIKEHEETCKKIALYEDILSSRDSMKKVIIKELRAFKKEYDRPRRTEIDNVAEAVYVEKKIEEKDVAVLIDRFHYARTMDVSLYERNKEAADSESRQVFLCKNTDRICIFTNKGQLHMLKVLDLPYGKFRDKGQPIENVSNFDSSQETCVCLTPLGSILERRMLFGTASGMIKQVAGREFDVSKRTTAATKLSDGDEVIFVQPLGDNAAVPPESAGQLEAGQKTTSALEAAGLQQEGESGQLETGQKTASLPEAAGLQQEGESGQLELNWGASMQPQASAKTAEQPGKSRETAVLQSEKGMFLRIETDSIPEKKKSAIGVRGIRLAENDRLARMYLLHADDALIEADYEPAKVVLNRLRIGTRDTKGVKR